MARDGDATQKSPEAFRTISEVSQALNVPQHVLRFWETRFSQIRPLKRGGNRRYYRPEDISLLRAISYLLYVDGYTIKGVQKLLRENGIRATVSDVMMRSGLEEELGESEVLDLTGGLNPQDAEEAEKAATGEDEAQVAELAMEEEVSVAEIAQEPAAAPKAAPAAPPAGKAPIAAPVMAASGASEEDMPEDTDRQRVESLVDELKAIRALLDQASAGT